MKETIQTETQPDFETSFQELFFECRDTCLWFWNKSVVPHRISDKREVLNQIEKNGTLSQFVRARELSKWL